MIEKKTQNCTPNRNLRTGMVKRSYLLLLIVLISVLSTSSYAHTAASTIVSIADVCAPPDGCISASIMVHHVTNLGSGTIDIAYDPEIVHVTAVESGTGNALVVQSWDINNTGGLAQILALDARAPHSGDVIFAHVTFKAVADTGSTPLTITVRDLTDYYNYTQIPHTPANGRFTIESPIFDTSGGTYPSISGVHRGTFTPKRTLTVRQMYTYPCEGTGGHSEYIAFYDENSEEIANAHWNGYNEEHHTIRFDTQFTLHPGVVYSYEIRTGSYPQIIHRSDYENDYGILTCTRFTDANGRAYNDWIPAITLE
jgi:hypothetical protein